MVVSLGEACLRRLEKVVAVPIAIQRGQLSTSFDMNRSYKMTGGDSVKWGGDFAGADFNNTSTRTG
jgi:hypothetical protein